MGVSLETILAHEQAGDPEKPTVQPKPRLPYPRHVGVSCIVVLPAPTLACRTFNTLSSPALEVDVHQQHLPLLASRAELLVPRPNRRPARMALTHSDPRQNVPFVVDGICKCNLFREANRPFGARLPAQIAVGTPGRTKIDDRAPRLLLVSNRARRTHVGAYSTSRAPRVVNHHGRPGKPVLVRCGSDGGRQLSQKRSQVLPARRRIGFTLELVAQRSTDGLILLLEDRGHLRPETSAEARKELSSREHAFSASFPFFEPDRDPSVPAELQRCSRPVERVSEDLLALLPTALRAPALDQDDFVEPQQCGTQDDVLAQSPQAWKANAGLTWQLRLVTSNRQHLGAAPPRGGRQE